MSLDFPRHPDATLNHAVVEQVNSDQVLSNSFVRAAVGGIKMLHEKKLEFRF